MRRIRLTAMEQAQLDQIFKTTQDRRLRDRCQAVLMASRGRKRKIIAQDRLDTLKNQKPITESPLLELRSAPK